MTKIIRILLQNKILAATTVVILLCSSGAYLHYKKRDPSSANPTITSSEMGKSPGNTNPSSDSSNTGLTSSSSTEKKKKSTSKTSSTKTTNSTGSASGSSSSSGTGGSASPSPSSPSPPSSGPSYDSIILADNPVAYWGLSNPGGQESDLTGNGHAGTYKGGTPGKTSLPNGNSAAVFNGSSEYVAVPTSSQFSIPTTHKLTWEAWIRPDNLQFPTASDGYVDWMGKCQDYSPSCEWEARMYTTTNSQNRCNRLSAYVFNSGAGLGSGADWQPVCGLLHASQWLHVVGEYQTDTTPSGCNSSHPGSIDIWVNGIKWNQSYHGTTGCMSQYNITPTSGNSPLNIGTMSFDYWFLGAIGKVAIYNYQLSNSQITEHYTAMTGDSPSGSCANTCSL